MYKGRILRLVVLASAGISLVAGTGVEGRLPGSPSDQEIKRTVCAPVLPLIDYDSPGRERRLVRFMTFAGQRQPRWDSVQPASYRALLNEWMFANSQRPPPGSGLTRTQAVSRLTSLINRRSVRLWITRGIRFPDLMGEYNVLRIGRTDWRSEKQYWYVISRSDPRPIDVCGGITRDMYTMFIVNGRAYFASEESGKIYSPYYSSEDHGIRKTLQRGLACY